ncbi:MAG: penicillin-binding protein 2 [Phycisphaerales bacterium]|nr:penicillin-binding protein 2 [Phycisphaerales bacterium]
MTAGAHYDRTGLTGVSVSVFILVCLLVVLGRVIQLQVHPPEHLTKCAGSTTSQRIELARRGSILDRQGRVIATSRLGYRLFLDPRELTDPDLIAETLHDAAGIDPVLVERKLNAANLSSRYVVITHLLDDGQVSALRQHPIRGVGLAPRFVREYPAGDIATSLVGKVGFEHEGRLGVELAFDTTLQGQPGHIVFARDARRRPLWVQPGDHQGAADGQTVQLTIDLFIQQVVEEELDHAVENAQAGGGRAVVLDPRTGEVLAMTDILRPREGREPFTTDPARSVHPALGRNRCVTDVYEPGSTFKVFMWSAMTELGLADLDEVLDCHQGSWKVPYGRRYLHDAFPKDKLTWREVLVESSNIGMGQVAERMPQARMRGAVLRFGFGSRTNTGLAGEASGIVTSAADWSRYTQTSVAMGHEIAVTPVQLARAFSVFARSGREIGTLPYLTLQRTTGAEAPPLIRVLPVDVAKAARSAMADVGAKLDRKLGRRGQEVGPFPIFGKSGTAQLPNWIEGGYHDDRYTSSFVAAAPVDHPRLVVLIVIDDPDKESPIGYYGSSVAGPAVRRIIDRTLSYLGLPGEARDLVALSAPLQ